MGDESRRAEGRPARKRTFSIERHLTRGQDAALAFDLGSGAEAGALGTLVAEVKALRGEMAELRTALDSAIAATGSGGLARTAAGPPAGDVAAAEDPEVWQEEARILRIEIARMVRSLATAKREIAEIKHPLKESADDRMSRAASELDEIVSATEQATHTILGAGETITQHCEAILGEIGDLDVIAPRLHDTMEQVSRIMEACSFQDITGQRVTKVVNTLEFIEDRIRRIVSDWGQEAFLDLPLDDDTTGAADDDDEARLLNGPQLTGAGLSQDDIDALFD
jgi:chemotaxis protein CheZ